MILIIKDSGSKEPIDKGNDAYRSLRTKLLHYDLAPYMQLNIRNLAEKLKLSSTPIREALIRLAGEGIIHFRPGKGFFTKPLNLEDVYSDLEMEKMILRFSIAKSIHIFPVFELSGPERIDSLHLSAAALDERAREHVVFIADLHSKIAGSSGNRKIQLTMSHCCDRLHHVRIIDFSEPSRLAYVVNRISDLLGSMARRNLDETMSLIDDLFEASVRQIERVVKDGNARAMNSNSNDDVFPRLSR